MCVCVSLGLSSAGWCECAACDVCLPRRICLFSIFLSPFVCASVFGWFVGGGGCCCTDKVAVSFLTGNVFLFCLEYVLLLTWYDLYIYIYVYLNGYLFCDSNIQQRDSWKILYTVRVVVDSAAFITMHI